MLAATCLAVIPGSRRPGNRRAAHGRPDEARNEVPTTARAFVPTAAALAATGCGCVALGGIPAGIYMAVFVCPAVLVALRFARSRRPAVTPDRRVALALDLTAAALHSGRPLGEALAAAAPAAGPVSRTALLRVAGLLRLGAVPEQAWASVAGGPLAPVAVTAVRSATSGIRLAAGFERLAADIRAEVTASAAGRAHRAGVTAMAPLGACFLPSFVCLGIVPVIVGMARSALGVS